MESDFGLFVHLAALLETGIPALLLSARLSVTSVSHLLTETKCKKVLLSKRYESFLSETISGLATPIVVKSYQQYLHADFTDTDEEIISKTSACDGESLQHPLILHSSGTTGLPKPIPVSGQYPIVYAACHEFPDGATIDWVNMSTLPLYHGFGLLAPCLSLSVGLTCCFPPSSIVPAANSTIQLLEIFSAESLMTVPSIVDDVLTSCGDDQRDALHLLKRLKFLAVGGGALKPDSAALLVDHGIRLLNHYGVTEIGAIAPIFCPEPDYDARFLRLRTDLGLKLHAISPGTHVDEGKRFKLVGYPIGSEQPFEIQDEMERNEESGRLEVRILGRRDDLIVLKTGEKVLARIVEDKLVSDRNIQSAVCVGQGYFELLVLIEQAPFTDLTEESLVDHIWGLIAQTNPHLDHHARISSKSAIILKPSNKAIPRSDKGSIMRREVHEQFRPEIEAAYSRLELEPPTEVSLDPEGIELSMRDMIKYIIGERWDHDQLLGADDFFELGMDSLQSVRLSRLISACLRADTIPKGAQPPKLTPEFIYRHPSIDSLSKAITRLIDGTVWSEERRDRRKEIQSLLDTYVAPIGRGVQRQADSHRKRVVLLTGSTGNLGAHVVGVLARDKSVSKIVCLNRPVRKSHYKYDVNIRARQERAFIKAGVHVDDALWTKLSFIESGRGANYLGEDASQISYLTRTTTHIFHMAWPMEFNRSTIGFKPHLEALQALIHLANTSSNEHPGIATRLIFTSSIAVVRHHRSLTNRRAVPEARLEDPLVTTEMGYAEAKWICEQMLASASSRYPDLEALTVRVGQLSGPERDGIWKTEEHIPALLKAAQTLSAFPRLEGTLSWLPIDRAAKSLVEIGLTPNPVAPETVVHLENPVRQRWQDFTAIAVRELGIEGPLVEFDQWLEQAAAKGLVTSLRPFFQLDFRALGSGDVVLETGRAQSMSRTLRGTSGISADLIREYIGRWRNEKFL
ncbi:hypothetical protein F5Y15DRAFT_396198 [Xylariaceae sp. FL0016]|nr:hypothetical protein F5Y15DRAFT_396198 [Xylariaceae sp. FL0016]